MARKAIKKSKKSGPYKRRTAKSKAAAKPKSTRPKTTKPAKLKKSRFANQQKFGAFLAKTGLHYTVVFGTRGPVPPRSGITALVRKEVKAIVAGPFELITETTPNKVVFVIVAFAHKSDFDTVCQQFKATRTALRQFKTTVASASVAI